MRRLIISSYPSVYRIVIAAMLVAVMFGLSMAARSFAANDATSKTGERLMIIHDRGIEKGVLTGADTVREALDEVGITISEHDRVEPNLDETLVADSYQVNIYRARPVIINDVDSSVKVLSAYQTPVQIAENVGFSLHDEDVATLRLSGDLVSYGATLQLDIDRATEFTLVFYGEKTTSYSQEKTVSAMLKAKNITLGERDTLSVEKDAALKEGMTVEIWRNGKQTVTEEEKIAFSVEEIQDVDRPVGYRKVKTPGKDGEKKVTYEVVMKNGKEIKRKEVNSVVTKKPVKAVVIVGAKNNYSGSLNEWLSALRSCESGGNYSTNTGNGFYGAYQFMPSTWNRIAQMTGRDHLVGVLPHKASPAEQDAMIIDNTKLSSGGLATQNPGCYNSLGLSAKPPS